MSSSKDEPKPSRIRVPLFFLVFLGCAAIGFLFANQIWQALFTTPANSTSGKTLAFSQQRNVLIIHTNELHNPNPNLISVWALFMTQSDPPNIAFKAIYPPLPPSKSLVPLDTLFSLTPQADVSPSFLRGMQAYDFQWDSVIVLDNQAVYTLGEWFTGQEPNIQPLAPSTPDADRKVLTSEQTLFEQMCAQLTTPSTQNPKTTDWREIIPNHMKTDLQFDNVMVLWTRLTAPNNLLHCEVLVTP